MSYRKHGLSNHPLYHIWIGILQRCFNPSNKSWKYYGARGITVCYRWANKKNGLENFIADMYLTHQKGLTLDRIDNNGNYEPGNCRWTTMEQQNRNKTCNVFIILSDGQPVLAVEAAEVHGIAPSVLRARVKRGDRGDRLFRPVKKYSRKKNISDTLYVA